MKKRYIMLEDSTTTEETTNCFLMNSKNNKVDDNIKTIEKSTESEKSNEIGEDNGDKSFEENRSSNGKYNDDLTHESTDKKDREETDEDQKN